MILLSLLVPRSLAETLRMPFTSMLNVHFDLRHAARCGGNAFEIECAEQPVVFGELTLTLEHVDCHGR